MSLFTVGLLGIGWAALMQEDDITVATPLRLSPNDAEVVSLGRRIYAVQCAACHGAALEGQPNWQKRKPNGRLPAPPHDETGHTWHHPDSILFAITKFGPAAVVGDARYQSDMPAYQGKLSDEEILAVLSYIKSSWPEPIKRRHDNMKDG